MYCYTKKNELTITKTSSSNSYTFTPVAIETLGAIGPKSMVFLRELGRRIRAVTDEPKSADYLLQLISVAVQRGNSIAVQGSTGA